MTDWKQIRKEIPAACNHVYLMSAAAAPLHPAAHERVTRLVDGLKDHGDIYWEELVAEVAAVRQRIARFLKCETSEIAFVSSTSMAMNLFAMLLKKKFGKESSVMSFESEFPSTTLPWIHHGYAMKLLPAIAGRHDLEQIEKAYSKEKILLSSRVQYSTGFAPDISALRNFCREKNLVSVLNATQAMGVLPVDAGEVDFMCASIHKWLMSGYGLAVAKVDRKYLTGDWPVHGWLSESDPWRLDNSALHPSQEAIALELGCGPFAQILGLGATIGWIEKLGGIDLIAKRVQELVQTAKEIFRRYGISLLYDFPVENSSGILILKCDNPAAVELELTKQNIFANARGAGLRVAIHYFNDESDFEKLAAAFKKIT